MTSPVAVRSSDMRQILVSAVVSAAVLGSPGVAGAEVVGPPVPAAYGGSVWPVAGGPGGRALAIVPSACASVGCNDARVAERDASGHWTLRAVTPPGMFPTFVGWGPGATATVLAVANTSTTTGGTDAFVVRRPAGTERFAAPVMLAVGGPIYVNSRTAADADGDIAILTGVNGPDSVVRAVLVTAAGGRPFGAPQPVAGSTESSAVAVGSGRVVVVSTERGSVYARSGAVGGPLGAPQLLTTRGLGDPAAAIDDAGNATVAFDQRGRTSFDHSLMVARARSDGRFAEPTPLSGVREEFGPAPHAAAAGTTTALFWQHLDDGRVHVAVARGTGRFERSGTPSAAVRGATRPWDPVVAVTPAGDVLLAYAYGVDGAVHATIRPARSTRFGPVHVVSRLGEGGSPSVSFLSGRRPLVVYRGRRRELLAGTRLTGPSPDLSPPRLGITYARDARDELRTANAVTVRVRCSEPCMLETHASLRTPDGRTVAAGVSRKILARGTTLTERFAFDPDRRAGLARDGARVRVTVGAQNASGAARAAVEQIEL